VTRINKSINANGEMRNFNPYQRGIRFEYKTRNCLRKEGWYVIRQPRSMFPDLIAFRNGTIIVVECKLRGYISIKERRQMCRLARIEIHAKPILAFERDSKLQLNELSSRSSRYDKPFDPTDAPAHFGG
jgi:Holliday junction resolvase